MLATTGDYLRLWNVNDHGADLELVAPLPIQKGKTPLQLAVTAKSTRVPRGRCDTRHHTRWSDRRHAHLSACHTAADPAFHGTTRPYLAALLALLVH